MPSVTLYTTERCSRCVSAKRLLAERRVCYHEVDLTKDPDGRAELQRCTGMLTFPQIMIGDQTLGGYEELLAADRAGRLAKLTAH